MSLRAPSFECISGVQRSWASTGLLGFSGNWNSFVSLGCDWTPALFPFLRDGELQRAALGNPLARGEGVQVEAQLVDRVQRSPILTRLPPSIVASPGLLALNAQKPAKIGVWCFASVILTRAIRKFTLGESET